MSPLLMAANSLAPTTDPRSATDEERSKKTPRPETAVSPKLTPDEASGLSYLKHLGLKALTTVSKLAAPKKKEKKADVFEEFEAVAARTDERRRAVNLAALDVWSVYNEEAAALEKDAATGVIGHGKAFVDSVYRSDEKTLHDDHAKYWADERLLVTKLKKRIESGEAKTIKEALEHIETHGSGPLKKSVSYYLSELDRVKKGEAKWFPDDRPLAGPHEFPLVRLIDYTSKRSPSDEKAKSLLDQCFRFEAHHHAVNSPYALYSLVKEVAEDKEVVAEAKTGKKALEGESGVGRAAYKFMMSPEGESLPADIGLMFVSAGLGSLARLKTLSALGKVVKAGHIGSKTAVGIGVAAELGAETTALWALSTGKEALSHDVSKVFDGENLRKSYASTAMMLGALKGFGGIGRALGGSAAKSLGMVTEKGLTTGGKVLMGTAGHGAALTGMIASRKVGEAVELSEGAVGGEKEALVHDVLGYVRFALAHKGVDAIVGGKLSAASHKLHTKIAKGEARLKATPERIEVTAKDIVESRDITEPKTSVPVPKVAVRPVTDGTTPARISAIESAKTPEEMKVEFMGDETPIVPMNSRLDSLLKARREFIIKDGPHRGTIVDFDGLLSIMEKRARSVRTSPKALETLEVLKMAFNFRMLETAELRELMSVLESPELRPYVPKFASYLGKLPKKTELFPAPAFPMAARAGTEPVVTSAHAKPIKRSDTGVTKNLRMPETATLGAMMMLSPELMNAPLWMQLTGLGVMAGTALWPKVKGWFKRREVDTSKSALVPAKIELEGLNKGEWVLGRYRTGEVHRDIVSIDDPVVSRKHAKIIVEADGRRYLVDMTADTKRLRKDMGISRPMDTASHGTWIKEGREWRKLKSGEKYELRPSTEMALGTILYKSLDSRAAARHRPGDPVPVHKAEIHAFEYTMEPAKSSAMPAAAYSGEPTSAHSKRPKNVLELRSKAGHKLYKFNPPIVMGGKVKVDRVMAERMTRLPSFPDRITLHLRSLSGKRFTAELSVAEADAMKFLTKDAEGKVSLRPEPEQPGYWITPYSRSE